VLPHYLLHTQALGNQQLLKGAYDLVEVKGQSEILKIDLKEQSGILIEHPY